MEEQDHYLIELNDTITNTKSIIHTEPILIKDAPNYFNQILKKLQNEQPLQLSLSNDNKYAQIYKIEENVEKGWIWNSTNQLKNILFKLSLVKLENEFFEYKLKNFDFNYGYAKNCFAPNWKFKNEINKDLNNVSIMKNSFIKELNYKLSLPNYGLKISEVYF